MRRFSISLISREPHIADMIMQGLWGEDTEQPL